ADLQVIPTLGTAACVPVWLTDVILKSLAKDKNQRFSSAAEVASILEAGGRENGSPSGAKGEVVSPKKGARGLGAVIPVPVRLSGLPRGHYVWLAVERGGACWPKEPGIEGHESMWQGVIHEGGPPRARFSLSLWLVDPVGDSMIRKWFETAPGLGYPPLG